MGNREALLDGAKRVLLEKGYAKTTARDVADAAGVSLAAIGYHFGSKESLLEQAFMAAMEDWFADDEEDRHEEHPPGSLARFRAFFEEVLASFPRQRALMRLNIEMGLEGTNNPQLGAAESRSDHLYPDGEERSILDAWSYNIQSGCPLPSLSPPPPPNQHA